MDEDCSDVSDSENTSMGKVIHIQRYNKMNNHHDNYKVVLSTPKQLSSQPDPTETLTGHSIENLAYSDDFESAYSEVTYEKPVPRPRSSLSQSSTMYSQDSFESSLVTASQSLNSTDGLKSLKSYSLDNFESSDSEDEEATSSFDYSGESVLKSPRKTANIESDTDISLSNLTYSETSSQVEYDSDSDIEYLNNGEKTNFLSKKIQLLRMKRVQPTVTNNPSHEVPFQRVKTSRCLKKFCDQKLELLRNKMHIGNIDHHPDSRECMSLWHLKRNEKVANYGISSLAVNRLKVQNTLGCMRKAANTKVHNPRKCKSCRKKVAEMAEVDFVKHKLAAASEHLVDEKLNKQLYKYSDPISMMKEGFEELPKLSDDPDKIFQRLCKPLQLSALNKHVGTGTPQQVINDIHVHRPRIYDLDSCKTEHAEQNDKFWETYFKPLETCPWFPNKDRIDHSKERNAQHNVEGKTLQNKNNTEFIRLSDEQEKVSQIHLDQRQTERDRESDFSLPSSYSTDESDISRSDPDDVENKKFELNSESESEGPVHKVLSLGDIGHEGHVPQDDAHLSIGSADYSDLSNESGPNPSGIRHQGYSTEDIVDPITNEIHIEETGMTDEDSDSDYGINVYSIGDLSI